MTNRLIRLFLIAGFTATVGFGFSRNLPFGEAKKQEKIYLTPIVVDDAYTDSNIDLRIIVDPVTHKDTDLFNLNNRTVYVYEDNYLIETVVIETNELNKFGLVELGVALPIKGEKNVE